MGQKGIPERMIGADRWEVLSERQVELLSASLGDPALRQMFVGNCHLTRDPRTCDPSASAKSRTFPLQIWILGNSDGTERIFRDGILRLKSVLPSELTL